MKPTRKPPPLLTVTEAVLLMRGEDHVLNFLLARA